MVRIFICLIMLFTPVSVAAEQLFMAGDSTMSIKTIRSSPETGWGMPFAQFFNNSLSIHNAAKNGRSTKTFISEGRWKLIMSQLNAGDYVIIQFGHNDQSKHKIGRYTPPEKFTKNLKRFISDVRSKNALPILMTPITRRHYDEQDQLKWTHPIYADLVRSVAKDTKATFIDMEIITRDYFQAMGRSASKVRFMHIAPDLHPHYPDGVKDNTHLNNLGAREVAQLVLQKLKEIKHPLIKHMYIAPKK